MLDTNLCLRAATAGNLTADEDAAVVGVDFSGPDVRPMTYVVNIPTASAGDTVVFKIQGSTDNVTFVDCLTFPTHTADAAVLRLQGLINYRYRRYQADVTDGGGGVNFGAVTIWAELGGEYDRW